MMRNGGLLAIALAAGVDLTSCSSDDDGGSKAAPKRDRPRPVLNQRERAVLEAAAARLVPGPKDDPEETEPGAREVEAAGYIVTLLGALAEDPPRVYAGGPFSDRAGSKRDDMAHFLPLNHAVREHWRARLADLVAAYHDGLAKLDDLAGGDFAAASPAAQDAALAKNPKVAHLPVENSGFTDLLFQHTIEGCYSVPEYGGNAGGKMWASIGFPGDAQPRGYDDDQVTDSDGPDPIEAEGIVADLLELLTSTAPGSPTPAVIPPPRGADVSGSGSRNGSSGGGGS
jgi:Gluconate 2-dehydrogenase subunit 3